MKKPLKKLNDLNCTNWFSVPSLLDLLLRQAQIFLKNLKD